jgi:hypothetical protein
MDLIDRKLKCSKKGAKHVKKLPRRPSNFPEGGIFKGQAPLKIFVFDVLHYIDVK